ncbi:MAG: hypothetical protein R3E12_19060 [Candidatus Eisenbacteria bacterium]
MIPAAHLRETLGVPGLSVETATLCRDKTAMKRIPPGTRNPVCGVVGGRKPAEAMAFVERIGLPVILKPRAGFGSLGTHKVETRADLERRLREAHLGERGASVAIEEFVDGHEGFYDTLIADGRIVHDFASHYYPGCLEALQDRKIRPQIAHTNRIDAKDYAELRELGAKVSAALGLDRTATHGVVLREQGAAILGDRRPTGRREDLGPLPRGQRGRRLSGVGLGGDHGEGHHGEAQPPVRHRLHPDSSRS